MVRVTITGSPDSDWNLKYSSSSFFITRLLFLCVPSTIQTIPVLVFSILTVLTLDNPHLHLEVSLVLFPSFSGIRPKVGLQFGRGGAVTSQTLRIFIPGKG